MWEQDLNRATTAYQAQYQKLIDLRYKQQTAKSDVRNLETRLNQVKSEIKPFCREVEDADRAYQDASAQLNIATARTIEKEQEAAHAADTIHWTERLSRR